MNGIKGTSATLEDIKHLDSYKQEFWYAGELMIVLEYKRWDKFYNVISNAKIA